MSEHHRTTRTLEWRGRTISWERFGTGPALVLLHGTPWSSDLWRPIAAALSHRFTVYIWDMPGYGASSKHADHGVDLGFQGELFTHLLGVWGLEAPHVVAHDIGGTVALRARLLHATRYASLCLVDVVALAPWGSPFFELVKQHPEVFSALPPAIHHGALRAYIEGASHRGLRPEELDWLAAPWLGTDGQPAFYRQIAQADERFTDEFEPLLDQIDEPTHIIWGAEDQWIPSSRATQLAALIPGASLRVIPNAGHLVQLDQQAELAVELAAWLLRQPTG